MSFSQQITSPAPNQLFDPLMAGRQQEQQQAIQQNQLVQQGEQQQLNQADLEQVARTSAAMLLTYPDEPSRAQAWPRAVGMLQAQGYAKNAPAQYPGEAALKAAARMGTPSEALGTQLANIQANQAYSGATGGGGAGGAVGGGTSTPAAGGGPAPFVGANLPQGVTPDEDQLVRTVYGEASGEPVAGQQAVASVIKTRMQKGNQGVQDTVFAPHQFEAWSDPKNRPRMEALSPTDPQYQAILNNVRWPVMHQGRRKTRPVAPPISSIRSSRRSLDAIRRALPKATRRRSAITRSTMAPMAREAARQPVLHQPPPQMPRRRFREPHRPLGRLRPIGWRLTRLWRLQGRPQRRHNRRRMRWRRRSLQQLQPRPRPPRRVACRSRHKPRRPSPCRRHRSRRPRTPMA